MEKIIKVYKQSVLAMRFIGKKYSDSDIIDGRFGTKWNEWFANDWFFFEKEINETFKTIYEDWNAYIGLIRWKEGEPFEYWIGMFMPENTSVPDGYNYIDFPKSFMGVCWVYGKEADLYYPRDDRYIKKITEAGYKIVTDNKGACWFLERYGCPRFTTPDNQGNIILDICHYIA
jgi:hypothetical protein